MTIVVGYVPGEGGTAGIRLGAMLAESLDTDLVIATVAPTPWTNPSMARVDAEFVDWTDRFIAQASSEVSAYMNSYPAALTWRFDRLDHRAAATALAAHAAGIGAAAVVLSSTGDGQLGQIVVGSTADALLHRCEVAVGLSPRGYRSPRDGLLTRVTVAIAGDDPQDRAVLARAHELADTMTAPLRVVTFAVRGGAMYPPLVGLAGEDEVLDQWIAQSTRAHEALRADGLVADDTITDLAIGRGWREAVDSIDWMGGEVLLLGSTREGPLRRVFIGSRSTTLIRHSPVPVVVLPR